MVSGSSRKVSLMHDGQRHRKSSGGRHKPGSVGRRRYPPKGRAPQRQPFIWALGLLLCSSKPTRAARGETPLPTLRRARGLPIRPCSRVGFAMRLLLPAPRCAFTAPFHPCLCDPPSDPRKDNGGTIGGLLSVGTFPCFRKGSRRALPATLVSWSPDFPRASACFSQARTRLPRAP